MITIINDYEDRSVRIAKYMVDNRATVRKAGAVFGISKSTVHKDITVRLGKFDRALYGEVIKLLDINKRERHIRGGLATRKKYEELRKAAKGIDKTFIK